MKTYKKGLYNTIKKKKKNEKKGTKEKKMYKKKIKTKMKPKKKVQVSCNFNTCDGSRGAGNMCTHPRTVKTVVVQIA